MDKVIHRNSQFHHALCGVECDRDDMTIVDKHVTCKECLKRLEEVTYTETKTETLKRMRLREKIK